MCHAVNAGITRAMREGIVGATNFLVPCPWFHEALALAQRFDLAVGVHLCLTCDWDRLKWGPLTRAASLCNDEGHFFRDFESLLARANDDELLRELCAQVERVRALGFSPTHLDSHMLGSDMNEPAHARIKAVIREVSRRTGLHYTYETDDRGKLRHFDAEIGLSGRPIEAVWRELAALPGSGTYHLIGHAAEPSPELEALCSAEHPSRAWAAQYRISDIHFFTSPETRAKLSALGFELVTPKTLYG